MDRELIDTDRLEGQFSRLEYQRRNHFQPRASPILPGFTIPLPAGARDPYFTDIVGNVSTSRFQPAPPKSRSNTAVERRSLLEVKTRYPLLGGWNYTFRLGWDASLGESTVYDSSNNKYIAAIPFFTHIPGSVVDDAEVKIILPEGAMYVVSICVGVFDLTSPLIVISASTYHSLWMASFTALTYLTWTRRVVRLSLSKSVV